MTVNKKIICPDCAFEIVLSGSEEVGEILECSQCGTELEIISLEPLEARELVEEK